MADTNGKPDEAQLRKAAQLVDILFADSPTRPPKCSCGGLMEVDGPVAIYGPFGKGRIFLAGNCQICNRKMAVEVEPTDDREPLPEQKPAG